MAAMLSALPYIDEISVDQLMDFSDIPVDAAFKPAVETEREQKRRQHRIGMVAFRQKRKQQQQGLQDELRQLEDQVKHVEARVRASAAIASEGATKTHSTLDTLRELVVEVEALRKQNVALYKEIGLHTKHHQLLLVASQTLSVRDQDELSLPVTHGQSGWRVAFPNGGPSFHFYPFTRTEFDTAVECCIASYSSTPTLSLAGEFLGWNVHHAVVDSSSGAQPLIARARFTKRVQCSLQAAFEAMDNEKLDAWPDIVTPLDRRQAGPEGTSTVLLQQLDGNSSVLARNIHGDGNVNLRYICLAQRSRWTERNGKRVITYTMVIADSDANKRSRLNELMQDQVEWVTEGGTGLMLTEVGDGAIDVEYSHWGSCQQSLHAQYLFVQWAQYALRWEQMVVPLKLLQGE